MEALVREAAQHIPGLGFDTAYADGHWQITLEPDGRVINLGYAREFFGSFREIHQLTPWELARLMMAIQTRADEHGASR